ncbi:DNA polymerase IV [Aneurinibacillus sp. Ricciae_BoGa-3]|uniref:Y-family DNA polymerase n=1 Tax=Aneurinibacillus sp. Ricciae_BoGa-3 TaxID=3022697 RepID=UPI0023424FF7|nr:DNA polymerase IV [Aneurinibacillus sp. Ricciae_BoGa-3]WCK52727.1 DNA polymerase IV [Aneurinibacillus sp. Ricciae_BoGa-3]
MILLCDMNSFFASVHQSRDPSLRGKPVIVAGDPRKRRGIVVAASYEAKAAGVYTTMHYFEARKKCPQAIFVQPVHGIYRSYSEVIMRFLSRIGPCEVASIDEAYVDITELTERGYKAAEIASYIQRKLQAELHIPSSVGAGPNKLIAKMCADVKKPRGFVQMGIKQFQAYFWPQPVAKLHGCGQKTADKLGIQGLHTIGQLAAYPLVKLTAAYGKKGEYLHRAANGILYSPVNPERRKGEKTIGSSRTFAFDTTDKNMIEQTARLFSEKLADKLGSKDKKAKTISVEVKYDYRQTISRSITLEEATNNAGEIYKTALYLYHEHFAHQPVRLFGIRLHNLIEQEFEQLRFDF